MTQILSIPTDQVNNRRYASLISYILTKDRNSGMSTFCVTFFKVHKFIILSYGKEIRK